MKVVKQSCSLIKGLTPYEHIERVGRTCYKSEDLITKGSADRFVLSLVKRNHWAILEHFTIYVKFPQDCHLEQFIRECKDYSSNSSIDGAQNTEQLTYFNWSYVENRPLLSGSFRAFHDLFLRTQVNPVRASIINYLANAFKYWFPVIFRDIPTLSNEYYFDVRFLEEDELKEEYKDRPDIIKKHLTHTLHFVTDRGVSHEFVRHRNCAFAQESTRYCNYVKDKFGNEITVIKPCFWGDDDKCVDWKSSMKLAESHYFELISKGATPQEARTVLPNSLKTELIITATEKEWQHIINLRYYGTTGAPHPQIKEAMTNALPLLIKESEGRLK